MAATEASAAPVVQEDGSKPTEAEQPANTNSETVNKEVVDKDKDASTVNSEVVDNKDGAAAVNSEVVENKENVTNDTEAAAAENGEGKAADGASGEADATTADSENAAAAAAEHKTSFLDSFLNKSGLGKVMGGRKKKDPAATGGEEAAEEAGAEKAAEEPATEGAAAAEGEAAAAIEKAPENEENKEEEKKAEKKPAETKSSVRDLIRNPVARMFSHRSTEKKDGEPQKKKVRSKSLDRLADAEALNASGAMEADSTIEEGAAAATGGAEEEEQKAATPSAATTKHMKRWHSFKKLMAQKAHKKAGGSTEEVKEEGEGEGEGEGGGDGGGDSSTLDSKESGQKRWKLKRSWTFQGMKRDSSIVGISGKTKDKDSTDNVKADDATAATEGATEGAEEAKEDGGEENKTEGEGEKAEGGEEDKAATAAGGTVTQHANEIWTNFKKRVIPKSKRANTECAPSGEEEEATAAATVEDGAAAAGEEGKDGKSAKAKRTHFNRAVSLKNFIMRKGKSSSVDLGEGAKEEGEGSEGGTAAAEGGATDGEAVATTTDGETAAVATDGKTTTNNDKNDDVVVEVAEKMEAVDIKAEPVEQVEKTPKAAAEVPVAVTNGENGCTNGNSDDHNDDTHNHNDTTEGEGEEKKTKVVVVESPVKKKAGAKDAAKDQEANAKIINATVPATVNSDKKAGNV